MLRLSGKRIINQPIVWKGADSPALKLTSVNISRNFSSSPYTNEGPLKKAAEAAEKAADKVNHLAGDALLKGIEVGETVTGTAKKAAEATASGLHVGKEKAEKTDKKWETFKENKADQWESNKDDLKEKSGELKNAAKQKWDSTKETTKERAEQLKNDAKQEWDSTKNDFSR